MSALRFGRQLYLQRHRFRSPMYLCRTIAFQARSNVLTRLLALLLTCSPLESFSQTRCKSARTDICTSTVPNSSGRVLEEFCVSTSIRATHWALQHRLGVSRFAASSSAQTATSLSQHQMTVESSSLIPWARKSATSFLDYPRRSQLGLGPTVICMSRVGITNYRPMKTFFASTESWEQRRACLRVMESARHKTFFLILQGTSTLPIKPVLMMSQSIPDLGRALRPS